MIFTSKHISVSITRSRRAVYEFAANPENFPKWLAFIKSVSKKSDLVWAAETDLGQIEFKLSPKNDFGIMDHIVTLPDGVKVSNHLRVFENGTGSEVVFTLFRLPEKTDEEFEEDAKAVEADLGRLKEVSEK